MAAAPPAQDNIRGMNYAQIVDDLAAQFSFPEMSMKLSSLQKARLTLNGETHPATSLQCVPEAPIQR